MKLVRHAILRPRTIVHATFRGTDCSFYIKWLKSRVVDWLPTFKATNFLRSRAEQFCTEKNGL